MLIFGGRLTLINHVLNSIPIHIMATISPLSTIFKYIDSMISNFFCGKDNDNKKYHWASINTLCIPQAEGGVGINRLTDICTALQYKQWWLFRSKNSILTKFLQANCCPRANPVARKFENGQSLIWKYMMKNRHKVEEHIKWQINSGSCSFWWDDLLGIGALAK